MSNVAHTSIFCEVSKMCRILPLAIFLIFCQDIESKETDVLNILRYNKVGIKYDVQKYNGSEVWNNIKDASKQAYEYIHILATNTKKRLTDWIAKIKIKAQDFGNAFETRVNKIKDHVNEIIRNIKNTGDIVKKCLQVRKEEIDKILKKILFDVTNCISNSSSHLKNFEMSRYEQIPNQTEFLQAIQSDVDVCMKKYEKNVKDEQCFHDIRMDIYNNMQTAEKYILQNHTETRASTEDILNTIVECTTDGIIKSTTVITNETIQIIECVTKG